MIGFLNPQSRNIVYRSVYSRLCQHQRSHYGLISLPLLCYESVFVYTLAFDCGANGSYKPTARYCCGLRRVASPENNADQATGEFAVSMGLLLASLKIEDDIRDARTTLARTWKKLQYKILCGSFAKARNYFETLDSRFSQRISELMSEQLRVENESSTVDLETYACPSSNAFGYIFGLLSKIEGVPLPVNVLTSIGEKIGASMVLHDCASDWKTDLRQRLPNPVRDVASAVSAHEKAKNHLQEALRLCSSHLGDDSISSIILHAIVNRLEKEAIAHRMNQHSCSLNGLRDPSLKPAGVILNVLCCIPCGDGAVAVDSGDGGKCCSSLCCGCLCYIYCCGQCSQR